MKIPFYSDVGGYFLFHKEKPNYLFFSAEVD